MSPFARFPATGDGGPGYLLLDGSMGTQLFQRGLPSGLAPEIWNVERPDEVVAVHRSYIEAGSGLILTNSFGGTSFRLALHDLEGSVNEINRVAAELACRAADEAGPPGGVVVAGSMGPTGELLEPLGSMTREAFTEAFAEQAIGLAQGGADVAWLETLSSLDEAEAAVEGIRSSTDLPICVTLSFDTAGHTMMGVAGAQAAERLGSLDLAAVGANCGNNLADSEDALAAMIAHNPDLTIIAKCNAGIPRWRDGELHYNAGPPEMATHAHRMRAAGVALLGGCCGSTPDHIALMARVLAGDVAPEVLEPDRRPTRSPRQPEVAGRARRRSR